MGLLFTIAIALALLIGCMVVVVLGSPVILDICIVKDTRWRHHVAVHLLGRFGPRILLSDDSFARDEKPKTRKKRRRRKGKGDVPISAIARFVTEAIGRVRLKTLMINVEFGFDDPALTGQVFGAFTPLIYGSYGATHLSAQITPRFDGNTLQGRAELALSLIPLALLGPMLRLGWAVLRRSR